jgi:hypothetical protein
MGSYESELTLTAETIHMDAELAELLTQCPLGQRSRLAVLQRLLCQLHLSSLLCSLVSLLARVHGSRRLVSVRMICFNKLPGSRCCLCNRDEVPDVRTVLSLVEVEVEVEVCVCVCVCALLLLLVCRKQVKASW